MNNDAATKKQELIRGWPVIIASFVGIMMGITALPFYILGPLVGALQGEFGWSRTSILTVASFLLLGQLLGSPIAGFVIDRVGPRRTALVSILFLALGMGGLALWTKDLATFRFGYFAIGLLCAGSGSISFTRAIGAWFVQARGLALGLSLAGTGVAAFFAPLLIEFAAENGGWRAAMLSISILIALAIPIVWLGLKDAPRLDELPATTAKAPSGRNADVAWRQALNDPRFYVLGLCLALLGAILGGIVLHVVPMLSEQGLSTRQAAAIGSLSGIGLIVGRTITGWLLDRYSASWIAFSLFMSGACGSLSMVTIGPSAAPAMVILLGLMIGSEIDLLSFLVLRYFGVSSYGIIYGALYTLFLMCNLASPQITGYLVESRGFAALFAVSTVVFAIVALLFLVLGSLTHHSTRDHMRRRMI